MVHVGSIDHYKIYVLDKETAEKYSDALLNLLNEIPQVAYTNEDILAEKKGDRVLYGKWEHSLILFDENAPIAVITGYERKSEHTEQYPENTLYINELTVADSYQKKGIGKKLLAFFLDYSIKVGFKHLSAEMNFSVQTNSAEWNMHVQNLYKSFGFNQRSIKSYDNRTDVIFGWKPFPKETL